MEDTGSILNKFAHVLQEVADDLAEVDEPYWDIQTLRELGWAIEKGEYNEKMGV